MCCCHPTIRAMWQKLADEASASHGNPVTKRTPEGDSMTEFKPDDLVKITETYWGRVYHHHALGLSVIGDRGNVLVDPTSPYVEVEKVVPPMPDEPGTCLAWSDEPGFIAYARYNDRWLSCLGGKAIEANLRKLWEDGQLVMFEGESDE